MSTAQPRNREPFAPGSIPSPIQVSHATPPPSETTSFSAVIPRIDSTVEADCLAHDARNWLTVLRVYCDLLRSSGAIASGYEKWMEELSSAVERGHELVNSLLDSAQRTGIATGTHASLSVVRSSALASTLSCGGTDSRALVPVSSAPVPSTPASHWPASHSLDVGEAIARRLPLFERLAGNNIHVELDTDAHAGSVSLPENAFERILQNLVRNAIEAMSNGGRLRIAVRRTNRKSTGQYTTGQYSTRQYQTALGDSSGSEAQSRRTLLLSVSDTGSGIAPERLPYIFEAGFSEKPECETGRPRHGFGLAIVRELTESAGGAVRVRSHPGQGSCFEIELPAV